jgi:hypothetical protein
MKCDKAQEFFSDYIENTLDRPMTVALETHLNGCEQCSADVAGLKQMYAVLDKVPQVEPPADFVWRTTTRLQNELLNRREAERARPLPWWKRLTPVQAFSYAGVAALLLIGIVFPVTNKINSGTWSIVWPGHKVAQTPPPPFGTPPMNAPQFTAQVPGLNGAAATVTITATSDMPYASLAMAYLTPEGQTLVGRPEHVGQPSTLAAGQSLKLDVPAGGSAAERITVTSNRVPFSKVLILPGAPAATGPVQNADPYFALEQVAARTGQAMLVDAGWTTPVTLDPQQPLQSVLNQVRGRQSIEPSGVMDITK